MTDSLAALGGNLITLGTIVGVVLAIFLIIRGALQRTVSGVIAGIILAALVLFGIWAAQNDWFQDRVRSDFDTTAPAHFIEGPHDWF